MDLTPLGPQRKQPAWSHRYQNSSQVWSDPCCKRPSYTPQSGTEDKKKKQVKKVNLFFLQKKKKQPFELLLTPSSSRLRDIAPSYSPPSPQAGGPAAPASHPASLRRQNTNQTTEASHRCNKAKGSPAVAPC